MKLKCMTVLTSALLLGACTSTPPSTSPPSSSMADIMANWVPATQAELACIRAHTPRVEVEECLKQAETEN